MAKLKLLSTSYVRSKANLLKCFSFLSGIYFDYGRSLCISLHYFSNNHELVIRGLHLRSFGYDCFAEVRTNDALLIDNFKSLQMLRNYPDSLRSKDIVNFINSFISLILNA